LNQPQVAMPFVAARTLHAVIALNAFNVYRNGGSNERMLELNIFGFASGCPPTNSRQKKWRRLSPPFWCGNKVASLVYAMDNIIYIDLMQSSAFVSVPSYRSLRNRLCMIS
jgi:hypothetical protein